MNLIKEGFVVDSEAIYACTCQDCASDGCNYKDEDKLNNNHPTKNNFGFTSEFNFACSCQDCASDGCAYQDE